MLYLYYYRALLQLIIKELNLWPNDSIRIGKLPKLAFSNGFVHYCQAAFNKLEIKYPADNLDQDIIVGYEFKYSHLEKSVGLFWTLRAMLGGVIESMILVDRAKYLAEFGGIEVDLVPVFDEYVSPRNMLLVGAKTDVTK